MFKRERKRNKREQETIPEVEMPEHVRLLIAWIRLIIATGAFVEDESNKSPMRLVDEWSLIEQICTLAFAHPNEYIRMLMRKRSPLYSGRYSICVNNDHEFVLAAVNLCGTAIRYASPYLRSDRDIVLAAVRQDGRALKFANRIFRKDREIVSIANQNYNARKWNDLYRN